MVCTLLRIINNQQLRYQYFSIESSKGDAMMDDHFLGERWDCSGEESHWVNQVQWKDKQIMQDFARYIRDK